MPYINPDLRKPLDASIRQLRAKLYLHAEGTEQEAGVLNYTITSLLDPWLCDGVTYRDVNMLVGVLECVKMELYRRAAAPYEDKKLQENGDVVTYKELE